MVQAIDEDSRQLAQALVDGTKIVVTTLQKFPFVMRGLLSIAGGEAGSADTPTAAEQAQTAQWRKAIAGRRYAVIVDEAHSSQTGESAREMKAILGARSQAAAEGASESEGSQSWEDGLNAVVESRGSQPNLSFFAFTATPKGKTIELFGRVGPSGKPEPFHVYSMRQAIEERFILDVLRNYTDYDTYFKLVKQAADDPDFPKRRTAVALARFLSLHPYNIEQKTAVIIEHFRDHVMHRIGRRAKAMVVTSSRQPLLQAMYVDKRLDGVQAVQTLSRLNRVAPGKEPPFVLDFVNDPEDIQAAFAPYYDQTRLQDCTDPYQLDRLKHQLDEMQVYHLGEVEAYARVFYLPPEQRRAEHHALLQAQVQPAVDRFNGLDDERQTEFRDRLSAFVSLYVFVSQIIPYADGDLEKLSAFGRARLPHLRQDHEAVSLGGEVELEYYRLRLVSSGTVELGEDDDASVTSPTAVGTGDPEEETAPLSEIIRSLNDRFGTDFTESDRLFLQQVQQDALARDDIRKTALANTFEKFSLGIRPQLQKLMIDRMAGNDVLVTRCLNDPDFQEVVFSGLLRQIFDTIEAEPPTIFSPSA